MEHFHSGRSDHAHSGVYTRHHYEPEKGNGGMRQLTEQFLESERLMWREYDRHARPIALDIRSEHAASASMKGGGRLTAYRPPFDPTLFRLFAGSTTAASDSDVAAFTTTPLPSAPAPESGFGFWFPLPLQQIIIEYARPNQIIYYTQQWCNTSETLRPGTTIAVCALDLTTHEQSIVMELDPHSPASQIDAYPIPERYSVRLIACNDLLFLFESERYGTCIDPFRDNSYALPDNPRARYNSTIVALPTQRSILVIGGQHDPSVDRYDIATRTWHHSAHPIEPKFEVKAATPLPLPYRVESRQAVESGAALIAKQRDRFPPLPRSAIGVFSADTTSVFGVQLDNESSCDAAFVVDDATVAAFVSAGLVLPRRTHAADTTTADDATARGGLLLFGGSYGRLRLLLFDFRSYQWCAVPDRPFAADLKWDSAVRRERYQYRSFCAIPPSPNRALGSTATGKDGLSRWGSFAVRRSTQWLSIGGGGDPERPAGSDARDSGNPHVVVALSPLTCEWTSAQPLTVTAAERATLFPRLNYGRKQHASVVVRTKAGENEKVTVVVLGGVLPTATVPLIRSARVPVFEKRAPNGDRANDNSDTSEEMVFDRTDFSCLETLTLDDASDHVWRAHKLQSPIRGPVSAVVI